MATAVDFATDAALVRRVDVGDILPRRLLGGGSRRIEATALLQPGRRPLDAYVAHLRASTSRFADWDGVLVTLPADEEPSQRLLVVDRYGQVYEATDAADASALPNADALVEWFRFLATACPECGVLDDPTDRDWTP